jgi:hypothetical protein
MSVLGQYIVNDPEEVFEKYIEKSEKILINLPLSLDNVSDFIKGRHDFIHRFVCKCLDIEFGEKKIISVLGPGLNPKLSELSPDIIIVNDFDVIISDISITSNVDSANSLKVDKYSKFIENYPDYNFTFYNIIISDQGNFSYNFDIINQYCRQLISNIYIRNQVDYNSPLFNELRDQYESATIVSDIDFEIPQHIHDYFYDFTGIQLESLLTDTNLTTTELTESDNVYIDNLCKINPIEYHDSCTEKDLIQELNKDIYGTKDISIICPIPCLTKMTDYDRSYKKASNICKFSQDPVVKALSIFLSDKVEHEYKEDTFSNTIHSSETFVCKLSEEDKIQISKEGPGKKRYEKGFTKPKNPTEIPKDEILIRKDNSSDIGTCLRLLQDIGKNYTFDSSEFLLTSYLYSSTSECSTGFIGYESKYVEEFLEYVSKLRMSRLIYFIQEVYKNIAFIANQNRKKSIYKYSVLTHHDCVVLVHPGSRLKGDKQIWFKIIVSSEFEEDIKYLHNDKVHIHLANHGFESRWLSASCDRVDYYSRIYDKYLMLLASKMDASYKHLGRISGSQIDASILILIENKSVTSRFVGVLRYFFMKFYSLSTDGLLDVIRNKLMVIPLRTEMSLFILNNLKLYTYNFFAERHKYTKPTDLSIINDKIDSKSYLLKKVPSIITLQLVPWRAFIMEWYLYYCYNKNQGMLYHKTKQSMEKTFIYENEMMEIMKLKQHHRYNGLINISDLLNKDQLKFSYDGRSVNIAMKLILQNCPIHIGSLIPQDIFRDVSNLSSMSASIKTLTKYIDPKLKIKEIMETFKSNRSKVCYELCNFINNNRECRILKDAWYKCAKDSTAPQIGEFPKDQYLGPREIYIMDIKSRIPQFCTESIMKKISNYCSKEFISKPNLKIKIQQEHSEQCIRALSQKSTNIVLQETIDNTKWSQNFVTIIFVWFVLPLMKIFPGYAKMMITCYINMTRKEVEIPSILFKNWLRNKDKDIPEVMKKFKEELLSSGKCYFNNYSHMGQGVFHMASSLLHCGQATLRDLILQRRNIPIKILDMITSDDRESSIIYKLSDHDKRVFSIYKSVDLLTRRLVAINQSREKSSISNHISEFNSNFVVGNSNLTPTLKWCISSCDNRISESISSLIQGAYNSIRDIKSNGGSSQTCLLGHFIQKSYIESLLGTFKGGRNDPAPLLNLPRCRVPYEFGVYPLIHMNIAEFIGPDFANWWSHKNYDGFDDIYGKFFIHSAEYQNMETYTGKMDIKFKIGNLRRLKNMRQGSTITRSEIELELESNPYLVVDEPENYRQSMIKSVLMLFSSKAQLSFMSKSQTLQFQRISAGKFQLIFKAKGYAKSAVSYRSILGIMKNHMETKKPIFPKETIYKYTENYINVDSDNTYKRSAKTQMVKELSYLGANFSTNQYVLRDIINYLKIGKITESLIKSLIPIQEQIKILPTLSECADFYGCKQHQYLSLLQNVIRLFSSSKFKICYEGPNAHNIHDSLINLHSYTSSEKEYSVSVAPYLPEHMSLYNLLLALESFSCCMSLTPIEAFELIKTQNVIPDSFILDHMLGNTLELQLLPPRNKRYLLMVAAEMYRPDILNNYMVNNNLMLHRWDVAQEFKEGYYGYGKLTIQNRGNILCVENVKEKKYHLTFNSIPSKSFYPILENAMRLFGEDPRLAIMNTTYINGKMQFNIEVQKENVPGFFLLTGSESSYDIDLNLVPCHISGDKFEIRKVRGKLELVTQGKVLFTHKPLCQSHVCFNTYDKIESHGFLIDYIDCYQNMRVINSKFHELNIQFSDIDEEMGKTFETLYALNYQKQFIGTVDTKMPTINYDIKDIYSQVDYEPPKSLNELYGNFTFEELGDIIESTVQYESEDEFLSLMKERKYIVEMMKNYKPGTVHKDFSIIERTICSIKYNLEETLIKRYQDAIKDYDNEELCAIYCSYIIYKQDKKAYNFPYESNTFQSLISLIQLNIKEAKWEDPKFGIKIAVRLLNKIMNNKREIKAK